MDIKERLVEYLKYKELGQTAFEERAGLSRGQIAKKQGFNGDSIEKIARYASDLNLVWLLTGEESMLKTKAENVQSEDSFRDYRLIPLMSLDVVGGETNEVVDTMGYVTGYIPFVNARRKDIAVPVTNDSMYPTYPPGSIVQIRKIEFWREYIEFGQVYVIELNDDRRLLKEIKRGDDKEHFILMSHNENYEDTEIHIDFIRSIWLVISKYQKCVM